MHIKQEAIFYCAMSWARIGALVQKNKDDAINTLRCTLSQSLTSTQLRIIVILILILKRQKRPGPGPMLCFLHIKSLLPAFLEIGSLYQNRRLRRLVCVGQFARPYCMLLYYIACRTRLVAGLLGTAQCLPGLKSEYKGRLLGLGCSGYGTLGARS
ncbi:unnamed protein product [Fusarium fujikuroi]|uniref:Uncharacterized protein n=1 Tax=Fusarium fujikuroi TaxID=5127 RepID=A0A9Q9S2E4_FUSFU|nr:unnamed protein product [Fusarium fujikuroi]